MLQLMRKHSKSFLIYVFFGIIIAVFVVNFGPQSQGCTATSSYAGRLAGASLTTSDFEYAQAVYGLDTSGSEAQMVMRRTLVMDKLVARELLASSAEALGLRISDDEIDDMLFNGYYLALGERRRAVRGKDDEFDYDRLSRMVRYYFRVTVRKFKEYQRRELLAEKMRDFLRTSVKVSVDEVEADFIHRNTRVKLDFVRFAPEDYRQQVDLAKDKIADFATKQSKELKSFFETNRGRYKNRPRELRVHTVAFAFTDAASKAAAKAKAEASLKRLSSGADIASEAQNDAIDHGWRVASAAGLGKVIDQQLRKQVAKGVSPLLEDADGDKGRFVIVKTTGERKGDLSFDQVKDELARERYLADATLAKANAVAAEYIKRIKAGEKLETLFERTDQANQGTAPSHAAKPALQTTQAFARSPINLVPRIGISEALTDAAFSLKKGEVGAQPFSAGGAVYLIAVADRTEPDMKDWIKRKDELVNDFTVRKWSEKILAFTVRRCVEARDANEIDISSSVLVTRGYIEEQQRQGKKASIPKYVPCSALKTQLPDGSMVLRP